MDIKGFQVWLSASRRSGARRSRYCRAGARARQRQRSSLVWTRLGVDARARGRSRDGAGSAALPVQGLRQDLQRAERYAAVGLAPQGTLAVVRGVAGEGGDGEGLGGALRRGGEHGVPLASPVSGGGAERFGGAQGDRGSGRDLRHWRAGRARAGWDARHGGGAARRRSAASRASPVLMAADRAGRSARCCPGSMRRRSGCPR